jgi:K+-sensing histidine kinase KdpD
LLSVIDVSIGTIFIVCLALLVSALLYASSWKFAAPAAFTAVVLVVARRFGTLSGVLGTVASALVFAFFLFSPFGTLHVANPHARESLQWLLLGGVSLSFLFPSEPETLRGSKDR